MFKLFLLRHGKATNYQDDTSDFQRHLNKKGTAQVNQIGYILQQSEFKISQIISSGATRTCETTQIINHYLNIKNVEFDDRLFLANAQTILSKIVSCGVEPNLLYVGHNNGISELAEYLTGNSTTMSTGELFIISFNINTWQLISASTGKVVQQVIPNVHSF